MSIKVRYMGYYNACKINSLPVLSCNHVFLLRFVYTRRLKEKHLTYLIYNLRYLSLNITLRLNIELVMTEYEKLYKIHKNST